MFEVGLEFDHQRLEMTGNRLVNPSFHTAEEAVEFAYKMLEAYGYASIWFDSRRFVESSGNVMVMYPYSRYYTGAPSKAYLEVQAALTGEPDAIIAPAVAV